MKSSYVATEKPDSKLTWCKRCHVGCLHWVHTKSGWRLFDYSGKIHQCKK